jgi:3-deoxy-D-manno-octulosonic-acid transferase
MNRESLNQGPEDSRRDHRDRKYKKYTNEVLHLGPNDILESQMRKLYSLLIYLITPLALLYLAFRGLRHRDYLKRWPERFGFFDPPESTGGIVVHGASLGEINAASALIRELGKRYPEFPLCLTSLTPTGSDRAQTLFAETIFHVYAPLDLPGAVKRFFDRVQPRLLIIMETEIWPNLYHQAATRNIPILIANARISESSVGGYKRFRKMTKAALSEVSRIAAQSSKDATRLLEIGADETRLSVTGNLKFDVRLPPSLIEQGDSIRLAWGTDRLVLLAGSTHEGDEGPLLKAFSAVLKTFPGALLVLVPRHPERFGRAAQLARSAGLRVSMRSEGVSCPRSTQCFVIDSMGELLSYYAACDVAFVGGSMEPTGGQNVLEPAALCKPVLFGPHTFNFEEITRQLIECRAAFRIHDATELEVAVRRLFKELELRDRMGQAGFKLVGSGQGALDRTLEIVDNLLTGATD